MSELWKHRRFGDSTPSLDYVSGSSVTLDAECRTQPLRRHLSPQLLRSGPQGASGIGYALTSPLAMLRSRRLSAYGLFIIDLVQTGLATWDGFEWFVLGWGNAERLLIPFSAPVNSPLFDAVTALLVQGYYCWRIYILSRVKWWPALLLLASRRLTSHARQC